LSEEAEERHKSERAEVENQVIKRKDDLEDELVGFEEQIQLVIS
jgi:hypothetical protein